MPPPHHPRHPCRTLTSKVVDALEWILEAVAADKYRGKEMSGRALVRLLAMLAEETNMDFRR